MSNNSSFPHHKRLGLTAPVGGLCEQAVRTGAVGHEGDPRAVRRPLGKRVDSLARDSCARTALDIVDPNNEITIGIDEYLEKVL